VDDYLCTRAFHSDVKSRMVKGGASGSLFFKSKCERFILKSCSVAEMKKLRAIAPALEQHFAYNRESLITKVFILFLNPYKLWKSKHASS
jgi:hypothetical protein